MRQAPRPQLQGEQKVLREKDPLNHICIPQPCSGHPPARRAGTEEDVRHLLTPFTPVRQRGKPVPAAALGNPCFTLSPYLLLERKQRRLLLLQLSSFRQREGTKKHRLQDRKHPESDLTASKSACSSDHGNSFWHRRRRNKTH